MSIYPTPFVGWNGAFKGERRFLAAGDRVRAGRRARLDLRVSENGKQWYPVMPEGDLADHAQLLTTDRSPFVPARMARYGGVTYLIGSFVDSSGTRAAVFTSADNRGWTHEATPVDGVPGGQSRRFIDIGFDGARVALLTNDGRVAIRAAGIWSAGASVAFNNGEAVTISGWGGLFVVGGAGGSIAQSNPAITDWTVRFTGFGQLGAVFAISAAPFGLVAVGSSTTSVRAATSASGTVWSGHAMPDGGFERVAEWNDRVFSAGFDGVFAISDDEGESWSVPELRYSGAIISRAREIVPADDRVVILWGNGNVSVSTDGDAWEMGGGMAPNVPYFASAFVG